MPTTLGWRASAHSVAASVAGSLAASCGWMPTEPQISSAPSAIAFTASNSLTLVQMVRNVPMPARRARASPSPRSAAKSGKSRWQWLSTSIVSATLRAFCPTLFPVLFLGAFHDIAREDSLRLRQRRSRLERAGSERCEVARIRRYGELVEQLGRALPHDRLGQTPDLAQHLAR